MLLFFFFYYKGCETAVLYTLSLHDALPIFSRPRGPASTAKRRWPSATMARASASAPAAFSGRTVSTPSRSWPTATRSEEHTSELQSQFQLVCRPLLEKKKIAER